MNFPCRQRTITSALGPNIEKVMKPVVNPKPQQDVSEPSKNILQKGMLHDMFLLYLMIIYNTLLYVLY